MKVNGVNYVFKMGKYGILSLKICQSPPSSAGGMNGSPLPGDCVVIGILTKTVMLNLVQHLTKSRPYETLTRSDERM